MKSLPTNQIGVRFSVLAIIYGSTLIFLALTVLVSVYADVPLSFFSRDPTRTLHGHSLTGIQSNLGVLVWWAAASICVFGHVVLKRRQNNRRFSSFLLWSGVITFSLALDDLFLFHDDLGYRYLGLNEKPILVGYGLVCVWYVIRFRRSILSTEYILLFLAFVFFGSSLVVDVLQYKWESPWRIFFEDGFKLLGIVTWSGYLIRTCFQAIAASLTVRSVANVG